MHFVYLLFNLETQKFYIGETVNLKDRLAEHREGKNTSTKYKMHAWKLIYAEVYRSKSDALKREKKLKAHGSGLVEIKKRVINSISESKTGEGER